jgi:hypothetical protein
MTSKLPTSYPALLGEIKQRIRAAQYEALKMVNKGADCPLLGYRPSDYTATNW